MYKLLLCWRYLRTRYLAMACIISVMLGVATLIVVNSVMSGFSTKLRNRLHGLLSDIVISSMGFEGFTGPAEKMAKIRRDPFLRERIAAMTPTMDVFAMLTYNWGAEKTTRLVHLIGIDPKTRSQVGGFQEHLIHQHKLPEVTFTVPEEIKQRYEMREQLLEMQLRPEPPLDPDEPPPVMPPPRQVKIPCGVFLGNLIASFRRKDRESGEPIERYGIHIGDEVILTTIGGEKLKPVYDRFVVLDYVKSEMSEYDSQYVYVPLDFLQHMRTMPNRVTSIHIKLKDYADAPAVKAALERLFPFNLKIETWEDKQGPLLQAIDIEKGILNVLLFLIIGVAGFGILAIFSMIVAEKTRDIGILKALGASNLGVMNIFLGYGLLLGLVGACLGTLLGLTLTHHINDVEKLISNVTGQEIFRRDLYYFNEIPTNIQASMVWLVNLGAVAIAVMFSIIPALRAACVHPVRALRYE